MRAIAQQAEAERFRRAKIINAEGEEQAARKLVEAGNRTSTIVFPIPIDLLNRLQGQDTK